MPIEQLPSVGLWMDGLMLHQSSERHEPFALATTRVVVEAGRALKHDSPTPDASYALVAGALALFKTNRQGLRQIVAIRLVGEIGTLLDLAFGYRDYEVLALTKLTLMRVSARAFRSRLEGQPAAQAELLRAAMIDTNVAAEWLLSNGRSTALARVAHLISELIYRMDLLGHPAGEPYRIPLTQEQIGDVVSLTAVHVNRTVRKLLHDGLIERVKEGIIIKDRASLERLAGFSPEYLDSD